MALFAYHFGWSLKDILNLTPAQISMLQDGLGTLLYDVNGGAEQEKDQKLKEYMATITEKKALESKLPKGKISLSDMLKELDAGKIKGF